MSSASLARLVKNSVWFRPSGGDVDRIWYSFGKVCPGVGRCWSTSPSDPWVLPSVLAGYLRQRREVGRAVDIVGIDEQAPQELVKHADAEKERRKPEARARAPTNPLRNSPRPEADTPRFSISGAGAAFPGVAQLWPKHRSLASFGRIRPVSGQSWSKLGQAWSSPSQVWSMLGKFWPRLMNVGPNRAVSKPLWEFGRLRANSGRLWSNSGQSGRFPGHVWSNSGH